MLGTTVTSSLAFDALDRIDAVLDLSRIHAKLAARDSRDNGATGSLDRLDLMEGEYRRFLALHLAYPTAGIVPCKLVDEMWHQHILDTVAYRTDCNAIFGHFLDHYPYFGMRDEQDARELTDAYQTTLERYRCEFGEPPAGTWIVEKGATCKTQTGCRPEP